MMHSSLLSGVSGRSTSKMTGGSRRAQRLVNYSNKVEVYDTLHTSASEVSLPFLGYLSSSTAIMKEIFFFLFAILPVYVRLGTFLKNLLLEYNSAVFSD